MTQQPKVWIEDDGILRIEFGHHTRVTLEAAEYAHSLHLSLTPTRVPVLVRAGSVIGYDPSVATFMRKLEIVQLTAAMAIITRSALSEYLGYLFLLYHKPPLPVRLFRNETEALRWLQDYVVPAPLSAEKA